MCSESDRSGSTTQQLGIANEAMAKLKKLLHAVTPWKMSFYMVSWGEIGCFSVCYFKIQKSKITVRVIIWAPRYVRSWYFIFCGKNSLNATLICIMRELGVPVMLQELYIYLFIITQLLSFLIKLLYSHLPRGKNKMCYFPSKITSIHYVVINLCWRSLEEGK